MNTRCVSGYAVIKADGTGNYPRDWAVIFSVFLSTYLHCYA